MPSRPWRYYSFHIERARSSYALNEILPDEEKGKLFGMLYCRCNTVVTIRMPLNNQFFNIK